MQTYFFPFALTVGGILVYHVSQKNIPAEINPFHATMLAYAAGILVCAAFGIAYTGNRSLLLSFKGSNWAVWAMGLGAAAIEVGFMLAYRSGWRVSVTAVAVNVAATLLLIPIGFAFFKENLSFRNVVGVLFCILGLALVMRD
jgi:uncharacterized membrane protein